jgi:peptide/nickel transport system permease protein
VKRYILSRILTLALVAFGVSVLVFISLRMVPGDAATVLLEKHGDPEQLEILRHQLGLDEPQAVQFLHWLASFGTPDWGRSLRTNAPVREVVLGRILPTVQLAVAAMIVSAAVGISLGVFSATRRNSWIDYVARSVSFVALSVPSFWLAILLVLFFSVRLRLLPSIGFAAAWEDPWQSLKLTALPALALAIPQAAVIMRFTRSALLEVLGQDYIRTARAKGLRERKVVYRHALKNALISVITIVGIQMGFLLGGAVVVETIFQWPGLGYGAFQALRSRDYPVAQGIVLFTTFFFALVTLLVDIGYALIDPRIRYD